MSASAEYRAQRREKARKEGKCTMCLNRKARKGMVTCAQCSKEAGVRRDRLADERKREARRAEKTRTAKTTSKSTSKTARRKTVQASRPRTRGRAKA